MLRFIIRLFGRSVAPSDLFLRFQRLSTRSNRSTRPCHRPTSRSLEVGLGLCPQASRNGELTQTFLLPGTLCGQVQGGWEQLGMAKGEIVNVLMSFGSHPVPVGTKYMGLCFNHSVVASHEAPLASHARHARQGMAALLRYQ